MRRLLVAVLVALALTGCSSRGPTTGPATPATSRPASSSTTTAGRAPSPSSAALGTDPTNPDVDYADDAAVRGLLDARGEAMVDHNSAELAATVSPVATPGQRAEQLAAVANTRSVDLESFVAQLNTQPQAPATGEWTVTTTLRYAFDGETGGETVDRRLLLARGATPHSWLVVAELSRNAPWDYGPLITVKGKRCRIVAHAGQQSNAAHLAALADAAVPVVTKAWGTDWNQWVLILIPTGVGELEAELNTTQDLSQLAAVQSVELPHGSASQSTGERILINPTVFLEKTSALGQQVILTHEITHVASGPVTSAGVPLWLVEGLADTVGFGTTSLTPAQGAPELAAQVKAHGVPAALPTDADFAPASARVVLAYEEAWLACRLLSDTVGMPALVAFYRAVGGGQSVPAALASVLHTTLAHFTAAWQAALRAELT